MKTDESFGIVPLSKKRGEWEVFLIRHRRSGYWGFPKGHAEAGETPQQAACRELKEETNLDCQSLLNAPPLAEQYSFMMEGRRVFKQVIYFIAEVTGEVGLQQDEIEEGAWFSLQEALHRITHAEGRAILVKAIEHLSHLS